MDGGSLEVTFVSNFVFFKLVEVEIHLSYVVISSFFKLTLRYLRSCAPKACGVNSFLS